MWGIELILSEEIRLTTLSATTDEPQDRQNITNKLCWLRYERQVGLVLESIPNEGNLLEIGCGRGEMAAIIAASKPKLSVIGLELNEMKVWGSLRKYGATYLSYDGYMLPFKDDSFDCCTAFGVIEHTENDIKFLQEINRVLKNNCKLFIFNLPSKYALFERVANIVGIKSHDRTYTSSEIKALMKYTNFAIEIMGREAFLPAQVDRVSKGLADICNRYYIQIDRVDIWLNKLMNYFAQNYTIIASKRSVNG